MAEDEVTVDEEPAAEEDDHVVDEAVLEDGVRMLGDAVGALSGEDVDRLLRGLPGPAATEAAKDLLGNKLDPRRLKNVGSLMAGTLRKRPLARQAMAVERLSSGIFATFETELGDRFENPSLDDLREVLDAVLAEHPAGGVRCTLSWVVAQGMPAAEAARDVLLSDARLRLPDWPEPSDGTGATEASDAGDP